MKHSLKGKFRHRQLNFVPILDTHMAMFDYNSDNIGELDGKPYTYSGVFEIVLDKEDPLIASLEVGKHYYIDTQLNLILPYDEIEYDENTSIYLRIVNSQYKPKNNAEADLILYLRKYDNAIVPHVDAFDLIKAQWESKIAEVNFSNTMVQDYEFTLVRTEDDHKKIIMFHPKGDRLGVFLMFNVIV